MSRSLHSRVTAVKRSKGRTMPAAIAYRAGTRIVNDRTGQVSDFRRKGGVAHVELVNYPHGLAEFANAAEAAENRKNSIVGREFLIQIPHELTFTRKVRVSRLAAQILAEVLGVAVAVALHKPSKYGDPRNWHSHLMCTSRVVDEKGRFMKKTRSMDLKQSASRFIRSFREQMAQIFNQELVKEGYASEATYDSRSFRDRGIKKFKTFHEGPRLTAMRRKGKSTRRTEHNDRNRHANIKIDGIAAEIHELTSELNAHSVFLGSLTCSTRAAALVRIRERERAAADRKRSASRRGFGIAGLEIIQREAAFYAEENARVAREIDERELELNRRERALAAALAKPTHGSVRSVTPPVEAVMQAKAVQRPIVLEPVRTQSR